MHQCELCECFNKEKRIHYISNEFGEHKMDMYVCAECEEWLDKIIDIRGKYVRMVQELKSY